MRQLVEKFVDEVRQWEAVQSEPHRFGGTEFKLGKVEIGHIHHANGMVDIPFTVKMREILLTEALAQNHHLLHDSGWITFYIRDNASLQHALWLMRLSYLQKQSRRHAINPEEINRMKLSEALKTATFPRLA